MKDNYLSWDRRIYNLRLSRAIALDMQEVDEAAAADQLVRDATNRMLVMNSERKHPSA